MSYNGAAVVAMKGKDCVAIASDRRFGIQAQTVAMDFQKVFEMGPHLYLGLPGLATDVQTVQVFQDCAFIEYPAINYAKGYKCRRLHNLNQKQCFGTRTIRALSKYSYTSLYIQRSFYSSTCIFSDTRGCDLD